MKGPCIFADDVVEFRASSDDVDKLRKMIGETRPVSVSCLPDFHGIPVLVDTGVPRGEVHLKCVDDPPTRYPMTAQEKEVLQEFWKMFLNGEAEKLQTKRTLLTAAALVTDKWKAFLFFSDAARDEDDTVLAELKVATEELHVMVESEIESIPETKRQP
jgi:hypothetical protein